MTETTARIRWADDSDDVPGYGAVRTWTGHVGNGSLYLFLITKRSLDSDEYALRTELPWARRKGATSTDPDELKAHAERWLAGFVSSLGAVFPEPEKPDPDCEECGFGLPRHDKDCSHYAMTCKHCKKPIVRCDVLPSHFGCSSAYGYVHDNLRAHACEPRSDGPYAQPGSDHA